MNKRVYFLMIVAFVVGMVELIIGGLLDLMAADLDVSLGQVGFLITIFSLIFAVGAPILLILTSNIERKRLTLISLAIFLLGNIVTVFSPTYSIVFIGRIISALSGSLLIILCLTIAPSIVHTRYRGRAIGIVSMGVSASIVLGIPVGILLGNAFGWRAPFVLISVLTVFSIAGVFLLMEQIDPKPSNPIRKQLATLKRRRIFFGQAITFLFIAGHTVLYAYLTPFVKMTMEIDGTWLSVIYLIFGIAAVSGGGVGGTLSDKLGPERTIMLTIVLFTLVIFSIPYTTFALPAFLTILVIWGVLSWTLAPATQSYLIGLSPETSDIQQSLNNSALHLGIAFGSLVGGLVIERASIEQNATVGGFFALLSIGAALISMYRKQGSEAVRSKS
ncbi:MFS transporter, DHA1 family, purine base/nucleoside efflux pump [Virgibacillus subterraneus]|uniref:MFS transporter, DHA1 family, purine base/nucleoside efflux pump n=1 Tax=Virgibacillus subterraneus TaxID=621109 RepID=A0A1H9JMA6_9BACI|nr:MFS transporter [Virgibacillus subterraneus]SEQ87950.1 MFS transporter, DHA1 family, purine base/nucleoside efflux pump [Virgibacillus subterraneus]